jgi:hypothetical protein
LVIKGGNFGRELRSLAVPNRGPGFIIFSGEFLTGGLK